MGLTLNIHNMKVLHQLGLALSRELPTIKVDGEALENGDHFQYLGFVMAAKAAIGEEIQHHLQRANIAFGRLRKRVFEDNNIRSNTKIMVYTAVVIPLLLYVSEMWTVYSRHLKVHGQYNQHCLCKILQICWEE
eukprot:g35459.t1